MSKRRVLAMMAIVTLGSFGSAAAQSVGFPPGDVFVYEQAAPASAAGVWFDKAVDVLAVEPLEVAEPVTGAPYAAEIVTEVIQPLADGNRIERRSTSIVARDSRGRVRREQSLAAIGPFVPQGDAQLVSITDPVTSVHYSLDRERKVAVRMPLPFIKRIDGPARATAGMRVAPAAEPRTESLGSKAIEGVVAQGTRTTITIEPGAIGNIAPIEIVNERWYSPELRMVVLSRRSDPRFGETTYRLEKLVREEPSPELFRVPADYKIETNQSFRVRTFRGAPPPR